MSIDEKRAVRGSGGFTLIEIVTAVAVAAVAALFFTGFLAPQLNLYHRYGRISGAKAVCAQVYVELEAQLRYGYGFEVDSEDSGVLYYGVRPAADERDGNLFGEKRRLDAAGLEQTAKEIGMGLEMDFSGTGEDEVHVAIRILAQDSGEVICQQETVIFSMYQSPGGGT